MSVDESICQQRVVLFMDILGFRELIRQDREADILHAMQMQKKFEQMFSMQGQMALQMTAFSDSVVVSELTSLGKPATVILYFASALFSRFLCRGILTRGGIAIGPLHHKDGVVFGKALVEAYTLESKLAKYPRIVVSSAVQNLYGKELIARQKQGLASAGSIVKSDFDGVAYVDTLGPMSMIPRETYLNKAPGQDPTYSQEEHDAAIKTMVDRVLANRPEDDPYVAAKYDWLRNNFYGAPLQSNVQASGTVTP